MLFCSYVHLRIQPVEIGLLGVAGGAGGVFLLIELLSQGLRGLSGCLGLPNVALKQSGVGVRYQFQLPGQAVVFF